MAIAVANRRHGDAMTICDELLRIDPCDVPVLMMKARFAAEEGRVDEAANLCRMALAIAPANFAALRFLCDYELRANRRAVACAYARRALVVHREPSFQVRDVRFVAFLMRLFGTKIDAKAAALRTVRCEPDDAQLWRMHARALIAQCEA